MHYHVSRNIAGYLPESEDGQYAYSDWESARDSLADDIDRWADGIFDTLEAPEDGTATAIEQMYNAATAEVRGDTSGDPIDVFLPSMLSDHALDVHFWVIECYDTECESEED